MSGSGAARNEDAVQCCHGGNLDASATRDVNINGAKAATLGTPAGCPAQPSFVLVGAATVRINVLGQTITPDPQRPDSWLHEVVVTGVEYDANGKVVAFTINDSSAGVCGYRIEAARLDGCLEKRIPMVVSKEKLW